MCGIAGFIRRNGHDPGEARPVAEAMGERLRHRGPDDHGLFADEHAALAHRRLSIIDLSSGKQPMTNEDGTIVLVYNGEIYNFKELREELEGKGHRFKTRSDTEVVVHAYEEYGTACVDRFNGMFAFALWDAPRGRAFGARDRMGQKPLYYALADDVFLFASELKGLLPHPAIRPRITPLTLSRYLAFGYTPDADTIYDGIRKLRPGERFCFENGNLTVERYWDPSFERCDLAPFANEAQRIAEFQRRFREAVKMRLISDIPLGVFLSGGIDSGAVVAAMCDLMPADQVKTFSIGFKEPQYDESEYARRVAEHFGTDHHERTLEERDMLDRLPGLIAHMDEPFADSSLSPTSLVSEFARTKVTVALGGDGGDELFAGYSTFWEDRFAHRYAMIPRLLRRGILEGPARLLFDALGARRLHRAVQYIGDAADAPEDRRILRWSEAAIGSEMQAWLLRHSDSEILSPESLYESVIANFRNGPARSRLAMAQYQFQKQYLPDDVLTKVDRASMGCSLEVRAPFLDPNVVDFANALPDRGKLAGREGKRFLKSAFLRKLPDSVLQREKMGFGIPLAEWPRGGLAPHVERLLGKSFLEDQGLFRPGFCDRLWQEHRTGKRNHRGPLWTLLAFQLWYEHHQPVFEESPIV